MYGSTPLSFCHDTHVWFRFISSLFEMLIPPSFLAKKLISSVTRFSTITMNYIHTTRNSWTNCTKYNESSIHIFVASQRPCLTLHLISEMHIWSIFRTTQLPPIGSTMRWRIIRLSKILLMFVVNFLVDGCLRHLLVVFSNAFVTQMPIV